MSHQRTNDEWLADLRSTGRTYEAAVGDLREYLLRAVLVYLTRHRSELVRLDYEELRQLAEDWAQQGLLQVLDKLDSFRGDSKLTTWAYRVVINVAADELRRKRWSNVSLEGLTSESAAVVALREDPTAPAPEEELSRAQVWAVVRSIIETELTERQRTALTAVVIDGRPMEEVARLLGTNRNNVYKIIHDARRKLRRELEAREWTREDVLGVFESSASQ